MSNYNNEAAEQAAVYALRIMQLEKALRNLIVYAADCADAFDERPLVLSAARAVLANKKVPQ